MLLENVMLSCGPQMLATSSIAQLNEQWSMTMFLTGLASLPSILSESRLSGSGPTGSSPTRTRMCWISTSEAWMRSAPPRIMMPGDGAVWPAMVSLLLRIIRSAVRRMVPDTSNTQTRARGAIDAGLERTRAVGVEVGDPVDRAAAAGDRVHAEAGGAGNHRQCLRAGARPAQATAAASSTVYIMRRACVHECDEL